MNIVVCVKQVPEITDVRVDPQTGTLMREGVASILNPFCEYALDLALELKKQQPAATITAVSMGPPQARAALRRCLEMGADGAILLSDRSFAGSDTWATAKTLAAAIQTLIPDYDLILVGKQAIDGDTAQVGPELAEFLHVPQITYAVALEVVGRKGKRVQARRETEKGYQVVEMRLPGLVSVSKGAAVRRVCSLADIILARQREIRVVSAADLGLPPAELGLQGSLTQVVKVFSPPAKSAGRIISGEDPEEAAAACASFFTAHHFV